MPSWMVRTLQSAQAVILVIVFAWALASAVALVRRHVSLSPPGPPTGSYVAVATAGIGHSGLRGVLQSMLEEVVADVRLGS